jgi:L-fuculose-phosphate aldolase
METLEHFAKITLIAKLVGRPSELPPEAIAKLLDVRERAGYMSQEARTCQACGYLEGHAATCAGSGGGRPGTDDDRVTLTRRELTALITEAAKLVASEMNS